MASGSSKSNAPKPRKRVEAETSSTAAAAAPTTLVRAKDGSAFTKCEECNKSVPVALISMHSCSLDAKIKMNLEAQVVEKPTEAKKKSPERKKATSTEPKAKRLKKAKDPNKPKRPPTAFFLFMDDFRKEFKAANPDSKGVQEVTKEGGAKWKSMSDDDKKPYTDKAAELKAEYTKALEGNGAAENENEDEEGSKEDAAEDEEGSEKDAAEGSEKDAAEKDVAEKEVQEEEEVLDDY